MVILIRRYSHTRADHEAFLNMSHFFHELDKADTQSPFFWKEFSIEEALELYPDSKQLKNLYYAFSERVVFFSSGFGAKWEDLEQLTTSKVEVAKQLHSKGAKDLLLLEKHGDAFHIDSDSPFFSEIGQVLERIKRLVSSSEDPSKIEAYMAMKINRLKHFGAPDFELTGTYKEFKLALLELDLSNSLYKDFVSELFDIAHEKERVLTGENKIRSFAVKRGGDSTSASILRKA